MEMAMLNRVKRGVTEQARKPNIRMVPCRILDIT